MKHYVDVINYAQATGDVEALAAIESNDCASCATVNAYLTRIYSRGGRIEGGSIQPTVLATDPSAAYGDWAISASLRFAPELIIEPWKNPPNRQLEGGEGLATFFPDYADGAWLLAEMNRGS